MSSTPLFDSIARRAERPTPAPAAPAAPSAPTSPMTTPVEPQGPVFVPASLVAAIEAIPTRVVAATTAHAVAPEQLVLVEAVADAIARAVADAVVTELDRIARDGVVRA
ncbi:hypothetical protein J2X60_003610 [Curtobacterium sp. 320]|uniref:hypothetical protein n=1 Tax=Curtobacterium sp. 320 TaxID=2817749 RepID=UPI0028633DEF|nr:hypothetical protein [Curtobacterium sp. 320]MDR6574941.1 hypothetical protein [Curtobacterium sp. 320]